MLDVPSFMDPEIFRRQLPRIGLFHDHDAWVAAELSTQAAPWPTSTAKTRAAPCWSRQSVKPPVEAPRSMAVTPETFR